MLIVERQHRLLEILREQKTADLDTLAGALAVSGSTVRRDLDAMEKQGLIERTHGGAVYRGEHRHPIAFSERINEHVDAKKAIGRFAASLVQPHMTLLLDGGSSVYFAAQQIAARPLQVVTPSLLIANLFANDEQVELLVIGGAHYPRTGMMVGPIATAALTNLHADLLFFSLAGIFDDEGFNLNLEQAELERLMIRQAARAVLLMDSSKFGRKSLAHVCRTDEVEMVVTDAEISEKWTRRLGDRLVVAT